MTGTTTLDNLLRGICEYPADTHRRLVYACEDAGSMDRLPPLETPAT